MPVTLAPCDWDVAPCGPLPAEDDPAYVPLKAAASEVLWALSGRQFGCCEALVRPCRKPCAGAVLAALDWAPRWTPVLSDGAWVNVSCGSCAGPCSCAEVCEVRLPGAPVCSVAEVLVDGTALDEDAWRVEDAEWLVRQDGGCFPTCQDMSKPPTEPGTWAVRMSRGTPVPAAGQRALGEVMSELWKACKDDGTCCLPKRVKTIARQGITVGILDPFDFLKQGKTGLYFTDLWLQAVNPHARPAGARVMSPDWPPRDHQTTWP